MRTIFVLALSVFAAACNTFQTKSVDAEIPTVRGSCPPLISPNCIAHKPIADYEAALLVAEKLGSDAVVTASARSEVVSGQNIKSFQSLTIKVPAAAAMARKGDPDVMAMIGGAVRFASNLSTPVTVSVSSAAQREFASHLIQKWGARNVSLVRGSADTIEIRRR